jgi:hypothetical protein
VRLNCPDTLLYSADDENTWAVYTERFSGETGRINFPTIIKKGEYITFQLLGFENNNFKLDGKKNKCKILSVECED